MYTLWMCLKRIKRHGVCIPLVDDANEDPISRHAAIYSGIAEYHKCDITDETLVNQTIKSISLKSRHPIRGLVACAGVSDKDPALDFSSDRFRRITDINITGTFLTARAVAAEMQRTNISGSIVLIASMSGHAANKGVDTAAYNTSKSGVLQLARSLASEWGSRAGMPLVRVNSLSPGYIRTAATAQTLQIPGMEEQWAGDNMLGRLSTVDEFRGPVMFLLGDASRGGFTG